MSDLAEKLRKHPALRTCALYAWRLSRDLPRHLPVQKIPWLQRWSGRPVGIHRTASDYLDLHPGRGWQKVIRPGGSYERVRPVETGVPLPPAFNPPQTVGWEDERVIFLENCRYWGGYGGSIITHDEHLLGELSPDVWGLERHALFNKLKLPSTVPLPGLTAVLSTPEANTNYSHWMMDLLPRLELLAEAGFGPEQVDRYLINQSNFPYETETLAMAGIPAAKVMRVDASTHLQCERIIAASLRRGHWQFTLPSWIPNFLRSIASPAAKSSPTRRLYLTRRNASFRRVLNEDDLLPALANSGFEIFDPGKKTVREQAEIFSQAAVIVSPHSSAMTNLVFCQPGTRVLEIFPADYFDVSFWTAASAVKSRYYAAVGERVGPRPATMIEGRRQDIQFPLSQLEPLLSSLLDGLPSGSRN
jgi:glycosyl transferase family 61